MEITKRLDLSCVTLVIIETREHALAQLAMDECLRAARFGEVLIYTNDSLALHVPAWADIPERSVHVPDWPEKIGWSRCLWQEVPYELRTSHMLCIQWDSWIWDETLWRDEFLKYDYIGAPWWYKDGKNVGNGGFSLRSTALMRFVAKNRNRYPCTNDLDDDLLCRKYRIALERDGFVWAPEEVARNFAFECVRPAPDSRHFGFHGAFNWAVVLSPEQLKERAELLLQSPHLMRNGYAKRFFEHNPNLRDELLKEAEQGPQSHAL